MHLLSKGLRVSIQMGVTSILAAETVQAKNSRQNQQAQRGVCHGTDLVTALPSYKHLYHVQGSPAAENTHHILFITAIKYGLGPKQLFLNTCPSSECGC